MEQQEVSRDIATHRRVGEEFCFTTGLPRKPMQQRFRLHRSSDIQRVRRIGKSYAHPLLVLITAPNGALKKRLAVTVSRKVGKAVVRNRIRRRIKESTRAYLGGMRAGWDYVFVARKPCAEADFAGISDAVHALLDRASGMESKDARTLQAE